VELGFGCSRLGGAASDGGFRDAVRLVEEAVERGVRVFDTADAYSCGLSERVLGRALRRRRDEVVIATKGGYRFRPRSRPEQLARRSVRTLAHRGPWASSPASPRVVNGTGSYQSQDLSAAGLRARLHASLRRLQTDHVDVYQVHGPHTVLPELFDELGDLVAAGKVLRFGIGAESVDDTSGWLAVNGLRVVQLPFGVLDPEAADTVFPCARQRGIELWARGVLGGGLLTLAERRPATLDEEPKRPLIDALRVLGAELQLDPYEMAIGYVKAYDEVATMLVGIGSSAHLRRNLALWEQPALPPSVVARVRALQRGDGVPIAGA
jgi:aryl-alcohol dehydrogenase-like predicted oxidoreductase